MTAETDIDLKAGRRKVARSRGALSGLLLVVFGVWAALVPFIGPYFDLAFTPQPDDAWHWTSGRGWLEVLPGAVAVVGGLLLLASASRVTALLGGWMAALAGAWLIVGPTLSDVLNIDPGAPDPSSGEGLRAAEVLLFFYGIGAAILFVGSLALGRLSVHSVRDVRAAERRAEAEAAEEQRWQRERQEAEAAEERRRADYGRRDEQFGDDDGTTRSGYGGQHSDQPSGQQLGQHSGQHAADPGGQYGPPSAGASPYNAPPPDAPPPNAPPPSQPPPR